MLFANNRFQGHQDIISCISYLPAPLDCYITSSWDQQIRLWKRPLAPNTPTAAAGTGTGKATAAAAAGGVGVGGGASEASSSSSFLVPDDDSEDGNNVSEYEKAHPLVVPKALSQVCVAVVLGGTEWVD